MVNHGLERTNRFTAVVYMTTQHIVTVASSCKQRMPYTWNMINDIRSCIFLNYFPHKAVLD